MIDKKSKEVVLKGKILKSTGKWYIVEMEDGSIVNCRIRGKMRMSKLRTTNPVAVGDQVYVSDVEDEDGNKVILDFEERKHERYIKLFENDKITFEQMEKMLTSLKTLR